MARQRHFYGLNHLYYLTTSTYRRARLFDSERFKRNFIKVLGDLRAELGFGIVGYVLMPEHFHLLIWPSDMANPIQIMQKLEGRTARFVLSNLGATCSFRGAGECWRESGFPPPSTPRPTSASGKGDSTI